MVNETHCIYGAFESQKWKSDRLLTILDALREVEKRTLDSLGKAIFLNDPESRGEVLSLAEVTIESQLKHAIRLLGSEQ